MRRIFCYLALVFWASCKVPDRMLTGAYVNGNGDSLMLNSNASFRIEMKKPDSTLQAFKYTTGRWNRERNTIYLTPATRSMGFYWQCLPLKASMNRLKRPSGCEKSGDNLVFTKVMDRRVDRKNQKSDHKKEKALKEEDKRMLEIYKESEKR